MNINSIMGSNAYASMQATRATGSGNAGMVPQQNQQASQVQNQQASQVQNQQAFQVQSQQAFQVSITPEARALLAADTTSQQPPPPPPDNSQSQTARAMIDVVG